ncbi:hypothetical protein, partial [Paenibacillus marchantiophytorum]|uniref:hypothetical protein n=1 Tax=Paenibacillus marchantiophytorum TaxID=1619310 RepID=UPI001669EEE6
SVTLHKQYEDDFQAAVDDAGAYLARMESQQTTTAVRYHEQKQLNLDMDLLHVFYQNLALKFGIENNPVAIQNLKIHMPAMVLLRYNGYVLVTLEDAANSSGQREITPVFWPIRPYTYTLQNGNVLYFTLDDKATVYDKASNVFVQDEYAALAGKTNLAPLSTLAIFQEVRQNTITANVEKDLGGAINRHMELVKRLGLNLQFSIPRGLNEQSIKDIGFMAFVQGYPLPNGERFDGYAFGGGAVVQRKSLIGTISSAGRHVAYGNGCVPSAGVTVTESLFDGEEAVRKGYFINDCSNTQ